MFVYWLMFFIPVFALLSPLRVTNEARDWMWRTVCLLFIFIIGLRFEVGGDWFPYRSYYQSAVGESLSDSIGFNDPGFALLNWLSASLELGVYSVNLACSAIVVTGVYYFCRRQPQPWLALTIAVPYMLIVMAMGYTRQSVAFGFELLALVALSDGRLGRYILLIACAALFHKTAALLLPLGVLASTHKKAWIVISAGGMAVLLGGAFLFEYYDALIVNYVDARMESEGGPIRVAMNAVPAMLYLLFVKRLSPEGTERKMWIWLAIFSLACVPLVSLASTAVDRVALYFMPIQLFVYARIGYLFRNLTVRTLTMLAIVATYGLVEWVLLNKATIVSVYWVPYQNVAFLR
jgi:hypothetical protein